LSRYATIGYGATCFLFGATPLLYIGGVATFFCGAADAVGATMRSTVVMLTTPDHLRYGTLDSLSPRYAFVDFIGK
jgi:hypothetical protein